MKRNPEPKGCFYPITIGALFVSSTLASIIIAASKFKAYWEDRKMVHNINIMISNIEGKELIYSLFSILSTGLIVSNDIGNKTKILICQFHDFQEYF